MYGEVSGPEQKEEGPDVRCYLSTDASVLNATVTSLRGWNMDIVSRYPHREQWHC